MSHNVEESNLAVESYVHVESCARLESRLAELRQEIALWITGGGLLAEKTQLLLRTSHLEGKLQVWREVDRHISELVGDEPVTVDALDEHFLSIRSKSVALASRLKHFLEGDSVSVAYAEGCIQAREGVFIALISAARPDLGDKGILT